MEAIQKGKFREDLYYRLSTVEITTSTTKRYEKKISYFCLENLLPILHQKYQMPHLKLDEHAQALLQEYRWNGNIRQLRNVAEQLSVLEKERNINAAMLGLFTRSGQQYPL